MPASATPRKNRTHSSWLKSWMKPPAPDEDHDPYELLRAPSLCEVAAGDLQGKVPDKENAGSQTLLGGVNSEVLVQTVQSEPDIGSVHERDNVYDNCDGDQARPALPADRLKSTSCRM